ncbi:MAG: hypothetical protein QOI66_4866 [Myxococcales bacterium]|jgi:hypothetical protein|nr:hypothetical protein [Myxococcales bacterium]
MWNSKLSGAILAAALLAQVGALAGAGVARADEFANPAAAAQPGQAGTDSPIPPNVEAQPVPYPTGGYCYTGPHPADTRVEGGPAFDEAQGPHIHNYPPIDLRLFTFKDGCYYFIGDPRDFGYGGQTYSYYGAHPVQDTYGGGWCFMMGGHYHMWQPWSPYFTVVGPWNYWYGPYDPFFWAYWPYYSFYYRSYYPRYYGGGRFSRGGGYGVAPPIRSVPAPAGGWRGSPQSAAGGGALGSGGGGWRGTPPSAPATSSPLRSSGPGWSGAPAGGWHGSPMPGGGVRPYSAPFRPSVPSGGGGGFHFRGHR